MLKLPINNLMKITMTKESLITFSINSLFNLHKPEEKKSGSHFYQNN